MKLEQIYRVRVVENPKIKFIEDKLAFIPSDGSKKYDAFMIYQHNEFFRDFEDNFILYCKSVKDYIQRDNFQNNTTIIDLVSQKSIADEYLLDGTVDLDYVKLKKIFNLFNKGQIDEQKLKDELTKLIEKEVNKEI